MLILSYLSQREKSSIGLSLMMQTGLHALLCLKSDYIKMILYCFMQWALPCAHDYTIYMCWWIYASLSTTTFKLTCNKMRDHWLQHIAVSLCHGHLINQVNILKFWIWHSCDSHSQGQLWYKEKKAWDCSYLKVCM